ncbi:MAG: discoidin domain-containing protein, partial [Parafilimonas sp.]
VGKDSVGVWRWLPTAVGVDPEKELLPGLFAAGLAAIGLWTALGDPRRRRWAILYGSVALAALALSLGPRVRVWGTVLTTHGPYAWLLAMVPGMDGMRVPARFAIIVVAALAVLVAFGVDWLLRRAAPRFRLPVAAACVLMVVADGWAVPITTVSYSARGRPEDRGVAFWLAGRAAGAALHLPIHPSGEQLLDYQFMTLVHGHPIVNGFSGYVTPLVDVLGSQLSPLYDFDRFPAAVRMLRSLGIRYVFVHPDDYDAGSIAAGLPDRTIRALRDSAQIAKEAALPRVTAFELTPWDPPPDRRAPLTLVPPAELTVSASESADRIPNLFDGDRDTRWIAGIGGQDGSSWLRLSLNHPADVARVDLQIAERSIADYPRQLRVEGEDPGGQSHLLYQASPYPEFAAALVRDGRYPTLSIPIPHNDTVVLWIRQTAPSTASWSVHELRVWRYDASGGTR